MLTGTFGGPTSPAVPQQESLSNPLPIRLEPASLEASRSTNYVAASRAITGVCALAFCGTFTFEATPVRTFAMFSFAAIAVGNMWLTKINIQRADELAARLRQLDSERMPVPFTSV